MHTIFVAIIPNSQRNTLKLIRQKSKFLSIKQSIYINTQILEGRTDNSYALCITSNPISLNIRY